MRHPIVAVHVRQVLTTVLTGGLRSALVVGVNPGECQR